MKTWDELLDTYIIGLRTTNYSRATIEGSERAIETFRVFCRPFEALRPVDVTPEHAEAWKERLEWQPGAHGQLFSAHTVQTYILLVRRFFFWALKQHHLLSDPFRDVKIRRVRAIERRLLTVAEVNLLLGAPDMETLRGQRDHAILETLYGTGIRREECCKLDLEDVDFANQTLRVNGKGGRQRLNPLGTKLLDVLQTYIQRTRPMLFELGPDPALFLRLNGGRIPLHAVSNLVHNYAQTLGLGSVSTHLLRHAFATHLLQNGAKVEEVQQLLGHENLASTDIYTHVLPSLIVKEHRKSHPRARRNKTKPVPIWNQDDAAAVADMVSSGRRRRKRAC